MKVMVVDDEPAIRELLVAILRDEGYQAVEASSGQVALELGPREQPDLLLIDLMMPGMDGRTLVARLRQLPEFGSTPMIMMSAAMRVLGKQEGVVDFLPKPFDLEQLLAALPPLAAEAVVDRVRSDIDAFIAGEAQADDMTMLGIRWHGAAAPP